MTNLRDNPDIQKLPESVQKKLFDLIEKDIPKVRFFRTGGKPRKEWKLFYADTWGAAFGAAFGAARDAAWGAAWDAAWGAARDAARGAAWDAARDAARDAAWDAARGAAFGAAFGAARDAAWGAAWDAAWGAARDAARGAAWDAARDAARDAAWDAARGAAWDAALGAARDFSLAAHMIIASDLDYKDKATHEAHVSARLEVWRKGYGLICDIDGVLYVYAGKEKPPKERKSESLKEAKRQKLRERIWKLQKELEARLGIAIEVM